MKGLRKIGLVVALLAASIAASNVPGAAKGAANRPSSSRCHPPGRSATIAQNSRTRVYRIAAHLSLPAALFACSLRTGRRKHLADLVHGQPMRVALSGDVVGYAASSCVATTGHCSTAAFSYDVLRRQGLRGYNGVAGHPVRALVVTSRGSLAVLGREPGTATGVMSLAVIDAPYPRRVDYGQIDPLSLHLSGSALSWTNGGQSRTAALR